MPLPLTKLRTLNITKVFHFILYLLENVYEEKFWHGILGERFTRLGQRYFGNDFVMLGILLYVAPILKTNWEKLLRYCFHRTVTLPKQTINVRVYYHDSAYNAINSFIKKNTKQIPGLTEAVGTYTGDYDYESRPVIGLYPRTNTTNRIEYNGRTIFVAHENGTENDDITNKVAYINVSMELGPFDTMDTLKEILQEWANLYNTYTEDNTVDILEWGYSWSQKDTFIPRGLDTVNLPNGIKENLQLDMERFFNCKDWYKKKSLPYRRGYLFYGVPGSGKTSLTQALAGELGLDMAIIKLTEINSDSDFQEMIKQMPERTIMIIEDVDHYDKSDTKNTISISGLLNGLDGINGSNGTMVFMTCNDINKLEPALLRPGRIDVKIEFTYATHDQIEAMYWRFFEIEDEEEEEEEDDDVDEEEEEEEENDKIKEIEDDQEINEEVINTIDTTTTMIKLNKEENKEKEGYLFTPPPTPPNEKVMDDTHQNETMNQKEKEKEEEEIYYDSNDKEFDDIKMKEKKYHTKEQHQQFLQEKLKEFLLLVPEKTVTTAELQNLFVTIFLECGPDTKNDEIILDRMFAYIPEFLEKTRLDREQAKKHDGKNEEEEKKEDDEKDENKNEENEDEKEEEENDDDSDSDDSDDETCKCKKCKCKKSKKKCKKGKKA